MAIIQKIRNRSGLMLIVIGGTLLLFVLSDAINNRRGFTNSDPNTLGEVNGTKISRNEYNQFITNMESRYQQQGQMINDWAKQQINDQAWNSLVELALREKEYEALGISSTEDEVSTMFFNYYTEQFSRMLNIQPDVEKLREIIKTTDKQEILDEVAVLENDIRRNLNYMKYQRLVQAAFIPTQSEAKYQYEQNTVSNEFRVALLPYSTIVDSTIKVSEDELKDFYNKEKDNYKQKEGRDIRFLVFPLEASTTDQAKVTSELEKIKNRFASYQGNSITFVNTESDASYPYNGTFYTKGSGLPTIVDSGFAALQEGQMFGPYNEQNYATGKNLMKIAKVLHVKQLADSVKIKHILISVRGVQSIPGSENFHLTSQERMIAVSDSLHKKLKTNPELFDLAVQQHSDDFASIMKGGELGWINKNNQPELFDSCMLADEGAILKLFSNKDGVHIIKILQQGARTKKVNVGIITRELKPSEETLNQLYANATEASDLLKSGKNLDSLIAQKQWRAGEHNMLGKNDIAVNGLKGAREVVKFAYQSNVGDISAVIQLTESYVVVKTTKEAKEGVKPLEDIKRELEFKVLNEKKAQILSEKLSKAIAAGANTLDALKAKFPELTVDSIAKTPIGGTMPKFSNEPNVMGMAAAIELNKLSQPIKGNYGVFLVTVHKREGNEFPVSDFTPEKTELAGQSKNLVDQFIGEALKANASIEDNRFDMMD